MPLLTPLRLLAGLHPIWGRGFRSLFPCVGVYGALSVAAWTGRPALAVLAILQTAILVNPRIDGRDG